MTPFQFQNLLYVFVLILLLEWQIDTHFSKCTLPYRTQSGLFKYNAKIELEAHCQTYQQVLTCVLIQADMDDISIQSPISTTIIYIKALFLDELTKYSFVGWKTSYNYVLFIRVRLVGIGNIEYLLLSKKNNHYLYRQLIEIKIFKNFTFFLHLQFTEPRISIQLSSAPLPVCIEWERENSNTNFDLGTLYNIRCGSFMRMNIL